MEKKHSTNSKVMSVSQEDRDNLKYPEDYVDEHGRIFQIPFLDFNDPNYFDIYEEYMVIRKKHPEKFKRILMGD